jgi:hypothetical protein
VVSIRSALATMSRRRASSTSRVSASIRLAHPDRSREAAIGPAARGARFKAFRLDRQLAHDAIGFSESEKDDVVAFLESLTDDRVRFQRAPFDHPELIIPDGHPGDQHAVPFDPGVPGKAQDWDAAHKLVIPPVGAAGGSPLLRFLDQAH